MIDPTVLGALNEARFPGNEDAYRRLLDWMTTGKMIAFAGAGVSAEKFPTWPTLLKGLLGQADRRGLIQNRLELDELANQIDSDPLEVAASLEDIFTKNVFRANLATAFRTEPGVYTEAHRLIASLNVKGVVTLNYDLGLENAFSKLNGNVAESVRVQDLSDVLRWLHGDTFGVNRFPVLHLHGTPASPNEMVITTDDYVTLYSNANYQNLVQQIWQIDRLLVVGFGFTDPFLTKFAESKL